MESIGETLCIWLKQRVRRQFRNIRIRELLRFEELLRTYVFIGENPMPFFYKVSVKAHNLFGKSFGFRRAIRNHILRALHRVVSRGVYPPIIRRITAGTPVRALNCAIMRLVVVDVQGLFVRCAAVVLGDGVS